MDKARTDQDNEARMAALDEAASVAASAEREGLVIDFDEALSEFRRNKRTFEIKFLGNKFEIPSSTPANFATFYLRHCLTKVEGGWTFAIPEDRFLEFLELMFGDEIAKVITESNVEVEFIIKTIVPRVLVAWGLEFMRVPEGKVPAAEVTPV